MNEVIVNSLSTISVLCNLVYITNWFLKKAEKKEIINGGIKWLIVGCSFCVIANLVSLI